jgi:hypothetical protein
MAESFSKGWFEYQGPGGIMERLRLLSTGNDSKHLAVILPGQTYTAGMPALFFPGRVMLAHGVDVLEMEYDLTAEEIETLGMDRQADRAAATAEVVVRAALAQRAPERLTLIGKSLGTFAMAHLLTCGLDLPRLDCIWITPVLKQENLLQQMLACRHMSLVVAGDKDPYSNADGIERLEKETGMRVILIEGAEHGLEVNGNVIETLRSLQRIVRGIEGFMGWGDIRRWWTWS